MTTKSAIFAVGLLMLAALVALSGSGLAAGEAGLPDPDSYPMMSDEELGQLRWALKIADQDLDDFSNLEGVDQEGMTAYRYSIAFMTYFLSVEQYHKLPAWPGVIGNRIERLIDKMTQKPVWEFWAETSKGLPWLEPKMNAPYPEERDPVVHRNIMYSGHLGHMIGLYETFYPSRKYDHPGSIVFEWSPDERYLYDHEKLVRVMHEQMTDGEPHCIECEPNACFPECNQHPVLSFLLYDHLHGTTLYEARHKFLDFFLEKEMINPVTHETATLYLVKQDVTLSQTSPRYKNAMDLVVAPAVRLNIIKLDSASADGWTAAFMHVWEPDYIKRHYPYMKENNLREADEESKAKLARTFWEPQLKYGFFAILAAEVGDLETRDRLVAFAHDKYGPVWEDGMLRYPYDMSKDCTNLTGKLIALARALPAGGLRTMHQQPFDNTHFGEPKVEVEDFGKLSLRRAIYDREKKALIVTTTGGPEEAEIGSILIIMLDFSKKYDLYIDGERVRRHERTETVRVKVSTEEDHDIILVER